MKPVTDHEGWNAGEENQTLKTAKRVIWLVLIILTVMMIWAYFARLDEVSTGMGKVVPTMQEQVIQSLEGGVLAAITVRQDDIVAAGQILAQLDPTVTQSTVEESAAKYRAALASSVRLRAEVSQTELVFPSELDAFPELQLAERKLYEARKHSLAETMKWINESTMLVRDELNISETLSKKGAASNVEVIRLKRQMVELQLKQTEINSEYIVKAREELAKANAEVEALSSVVKGRADSLSRMTIRSPVRGIVKNIEVSTIGGVVPPNGKLMGIVPLDEKLLVEAQISPRDIAYIHLDQRATVKITAYDYAIYGGMEGKVTSISPDTIRDETQQDVFYYRVFIETERDALFNKDNVRFPIGTGMVATVDIHTGSKTVMEYLIKPFNRAKEALRER